MHDLLQTSHIAENIIALQIKVAIRDDENIYYQKVVQIYVTSWHMTKLLGSIYHGRDDIMASAIEHGRVPSHQGHWDSTEELACWLSLVTALLSGQGLPHDKAKRTQQGILLIPIEN